MFCGQKVRMKSPLLVAGLGAVGCPPAGAVDAAGRRGGVVGELAAEAGRCSECEPGASTFAAGPVDGTAPAA
jgi:hypothetical protein